jgi:hypothetical protein
MEENIRQDSEIAVIQREALPLKEKISTLIISDESSAKIGSTYLAFIAKAVKRLEERRVFFTKPILESKKNIDNEFKEMLEPLKQMADELKDKLLGYQNILIQQEQERLRKVTEFAEKNNLPIPAKVEEARTEPIRTTIGSTFTTKRFTFRIVDVSKIPDEYKAIDETKIRNMIRAKTSTVHGVTTCDLAIDGVEIFQETGISVRT